METYTCGERQDYQQYDRIWQRVSPELNPYPEIRAEQAAEQIVALAPAAGQLENLPGAVADPCCMGTQARQSLGVLQGFLNEECRQRTVYLTQSRRQSRQERAALMRRMAEISLENIRQLMAACFLITGQCSRPVVQAADGERVDWCRLLRFCYHEEVCDRLNYTRAAEEAVDLCVRELFSRLAETSRQQAEELFDELSRLMCHRKR